MKTKTVVTVLFLTALSGLLSAQTAPPPVPSSTVTEFLQTNVDNLYTKLSANRATAQDYAQTAAAVQLWFAYIAEIGYTPYETQFIQQAVTPLPISMTQIETVIGRNSIAGMTMTQAEATEFVLLAGAHFAQTQSVFAAQGPAGLAAAVVDVLSHGKGQISTASAESFGLANQYLGMIGYRLTYNALPGISWLTAAPGWAESMCKLPFILAILERNAGL